MAQATNTMTLLTNFMLYYPSYRQLGDLGVLREVFHGFSEEARTRGFPSPPFGGFGFVTDVNQTDVRQLYSKNDQFAYICRKTTTARNVRIGSSAALQNTSSSRAAFGGEAVVPAG